MEVLLRESMETLEVGYTYSYDELATMLTGPRHHHDQELLRSRWSQPHLLVVQGCDFWRAFEDGLSCGWQDMRNKRREDVRMLSAGDWGSKLYVTERSRSLWDHCFYLYIVSFVWMYILHTNIYECCS